MKGLKSIIYPVKDLEKAKKLFSALLGMAPYADAPYYVGYKIGETDIGLDPNGHANGMSGPVTYYHVDDINGTLAQLYAAGAQAMQPVKDVGGGNLIASVKDVDGNPIGLMQAVQ